MHLPQAVRLAVLPFTLATLGACSATVSAPEQAASPKPAATSVVVAVEPSSPSLRPSEAVAFAAAVTGAVNTSVRWSVRETGGGAIDGTGRYLAPAVAGTFHVDATSVADPAATAAATVTVAAPPPPPVVVSVTPSASSVDACHSLTLTAAVGGTTDTAVTWAVLEGAAGGAVTPAGVYTAPSSGGTYHLVATSAADPASSATAVVTVVERVLSVEVTPPSASVQTGAAAQFTATVTTTCGRFATAASIGPAGRVVTN